MKNLKTLQIVFVLLLMTACGPSIRQNNESNFLGSLGQFLWERDWRYPIQQLPKNLRLVTSKLGPLKVKEGQFRYQVAKENRPWSSWWYPLRDKSLYEGARAPLVKYDQMLARLGKNSVVADRFKARAQGEVATWEGLCDAWALASVFEFEPLQSIRVGETCLTPGDQKALLSVAYKDAGADLKNNYFGQINKNTSQDIYSDIYPDQLHRLLQREIGERGSAIIIDMDPGIQVWNTPVYDAEIIISRKSDDRVDVEMILTSPEYQLTEEQKAQDKIGTLGNLFAKRQYTYSLYGSWTQDSFEVIGGEWTGDSDRNHPDYAIALPSSNKLMIEKSANLGGDQLSYSQLIELIQSGVPVGSCN